MILPLTLHHMQLRISAMPSLGYVAGTLKSYLFLSPPPQFSLLSKAGWVGMSWYGPRAWFILFPYHLAYDPSLVLLWLLFEEMSCVLPTEDGSLMNVK